MDFSLAFISKDFYFLISDGELRLFVPLYICCYFLLFNDIEAHKIRNQLYYERK